MMDVVYIHDLEVCTVIGIHDWERSIRQRVRIDIEMGFDIQKAALSDKIEDALDYEAVSKRLVAFIEGSRFHLIETMAEQCARIIIDEFHVPWVRLRLAKPGAVRGAREAGVLIERGKGGSGFIPYGPVVCGS